MGNREIIKSDYDEICKKYASLAINLKESLQTLLTEGKIKTLDIQYRIKDYDSLILKIDKKSYQDPMSEVEDICGLRVICYFPSDVDKIDGIIRKEFDVLDFIDKEKELEADRFGYRSKHYIIKVKQHWLGIPNYRGLGELKAEIQVRTILMHSWAEIEHKLSYKSEKDAPQHLKRKLNGLAALIELADDQFEQIKRKKEGYVASITPKSGSNFDLNQEMNVDTLQTFLDFYMPERTRARNAVPELLDELLTLKISFRDIYDAYQKAKSYLREASEITRGIPRDEWAQVGAVRVSMELANDTYWRSREEKFSKTRHPVFSEKYKDLRQKINRQK